MPRIRLADLETARRDPTAYRQERLEQAVQPRFGGVTYVGAIRHAILRYHRLQDGNGAQRYLEDLLTRHNLTNVKRTNETLEQLDWYVDEYESRNWPLVRLRVSIKVPLPPRVPPDLDCGGEVFRVDLNPAGGYACWLLQQGAPSDWREELRFPLMQRAIARDVFAVPLSEVAVGIIALNDRAVPSHTYSDAEITEAEVHLDRLIARMGYFRTVSSNKETGTAVHPTL